MSAIRRSLALLLSAGLLAGCMTYTTLMHPGEKTELGTLEPGMTREQVDAILGDPERVEGHLAYHEVNLKGVGHSPSRWWLPVAVAADATFFLLEPALAYGQYAAIQQQQALIAVAYGPDGRLIGPDHDGARAGYRRFLTAVRQEGLLHLVCRAANQGYAPAAQAQATRYLYGLWDTEPDIGQAYLWASLAIFAGRQDAVELQARVASLLLVEQRLALDRAFASWQPIPCPEHPRGYQRPAADPPSGTAAR